MSSSNVNREQENGFDEEESLTKDILEGYNKIQTHSETACDRNRVNPPRTQITVATLINETQIPNRQIDEADFTKKSLKVESFSTVRKPLRKVLTEKRLRSRKKSKILKNLRQTPSRRRVVESVKTKLKDKKDNLQEEEESEKETNKESVERSEEAPKRGKRGLVGGKAKAKPPKEDFNSSHDSEEDADTFHFYRISLGYFQKFRNVQGASTSTRHEPSLDKSSTFFKNQRLGGRTSEEKELLELRRWGVSPLITNDSYIVETNDPGVNSPENSEEDEVNFTVNNSLYQDLSDPLGDVRKVERDTGFISGKATSKICSNPESLLTGDVNYKWIQTPDTISVEIKCPVDVITSNQVSVKTTPVTLEINIKSTNESEWTPFFNCNLAGRISPQGSTWCFGPSRSIYIFLKKLENDFWESFIRSPADTPSDTLAGGSQTDLDEIYQPPILDIIKNLSVIEINKTYTREQYKSYTNKPEACTKDLRDVMQSGEEFKEVEK